MKNQANSFPADRLPLRRDLSPAFTLSIVTAFLMTAASLGGLLFPSSIYPTDELLRSFLANDLVNLLIGLPVLLASLWLARRGNLVGLLSWPGALLYITYNYLAYLFGIPFGGITLLYLALALLSVWSFVALLRNVDTNSLQMRLTGTIPFRLSGWVLLLFGIAFAFRAIGILFQPDVDQIPVTEVGVLVADLAISTLWIVGSILLLRQKSLGYASVLGLLIVGSELFIALILFLLLQPILTDTPFAIFDVIVVFIMGLVCFVPTGLFMRGISSKGKSS